MNDIAAFAVSHDELPETITDVFAELWEVLEVAKAAQNAGDGARCLAAAFGGDEGFQARQIGVGVRRTGAISACAAADAGAGCPW